MWPVSILVTNTTLIHMIEQCEWGDYVRKKICGGETYEIIGQILHKFSNGTCVEIWDFQNQYWNILSWLMDGNKMIS